MSGFGSLEAFNYHGLGNVSTVAVNDKLLTLDDMQKMQDTLIAESQPTQEQRLIDIEKKLDMLINQLAPEINV